MHYNEINWDDVESATATENGLVLTYRTPQVGVGQTQVVPLELNGTPEQAAEFNARFGTVGQTMARYGGPYYGGGFDGRFGPTVPIFTRSPAGSMQQIPGGPLVEKHYVWISTAPKSPPDSRGISQYSFSTLIFGGYFTGPVIEPIANLPPNQPPFPMSWSYTQAFYNFLCNQIKAKGKQGVPIYIDLDGKPLLDGGTPACGVQ